MSSFHGKFCWYELMTSDIDGADAFYRAVVGWDIEAAGMGDMDYRLLKTDGIGVGGVMTLPAEAAAAGGRPGWIGYIAVDDVDVYANRVVQAGGQVHRPPGDIPGVGRFSVVADPQGASFVLFKTSDEMASAPPPEPQVGQAGSFGWRELMATDWSSAFDFYSGLFGWTKGDPFDMGPMGVYQLFKESDELIGGMMDKPAALPVPFWTYYAMVNGIQAAKARVEAAGGQVIMGPHQVPTGQWIIQAIDPQGAAFALLSDTE